MDDTLPGGEWRTIVDPDAARFLTDARQRRYVGPFLRRETTVAQAAAELSVNADDMYYRVKRMQRFGVLAVTRTEPRAGRPLKYYSVGARGLFVPFAATDYETVEAMLLAMESANQEQFTRSMAASLTEPDAGGEATWGCLVYADAAGIVRYRMRRQGGSEADARRSLLDPDGPAIYTVWRALRLRRDDAKELQSRLDDLVQAFERRAARREGDDEARSFLVRLALTPLGDR